jgi:tripartite-type tricarboxylate transporter receptor subunit TctC
LPTIAAAGLPGYEADTPLGVLVPAGTPVKVIERLNQGLAAILGMADVEKLVVAQGADVVAGSPAEFAATLKSEIARWGKLIKEKKLSEQQ